MIILDHNITRDQVEQLQQWRIHCRQIGFQVGRPEWDDQQEILRYLHQTNHATFFTRDFDFYLSELCHDNYCLVIIAFPASETATMIRRLLRHQQFKTKAQRCGKIIKLSAGKIAWWEAGSHNQQYLIW
ncbi:MAG: DUF5615 family PIN-like protein [Blastocatellia bacterium]